MKPPQRVIWSEGMLMSPHHLQQLDLYHEELLSQRLRAATPYDWGILGIELDRRALAAGELRVARFSGVLPDGLVLRFDGDDPETPPSRPIDGHFGPTQSTLEVFVGVAREREGAANYVDGAAHQRVRFTVAKRSIPDTGTGASERLVAFGQRNVVVLFGDEPREDYEALKVAEVTRDGQGTLVVGESYIPPLLRIGASPFLVEGLKRLLALAAAKQRTLAEGRRQREGAHVEFNASDITRYLLLHALNGTIPVLSHLVELPDLSPRALYLLLLQFAGALSSFASDGDPTGMPPFLYTDLRTTFEPLLARLTALLGATVKENFIRTTLDARKDGLHFGRLEDERLLRASQFVLAVRSQLKEAQTVEQLPKLSKVAAWSEINAIVQAAAPGVPLTVAHRPPSEIPLIEGTVYFTLSTADRAWRHILAERTIAVYLPPPFLPDETQLQLLAVPPPSAAPGRP